MKLNVGLLLFVGLIISGYAMADEVRLYVSPSGSDANPGTESKPFATLERVRDEARTHKGKPVVVKIRGRFDVKKTFELNAEDSGAAKAPIVYRGGKDAIFSGGIRVTDFVPVTSADILQRLPEEARGKVLQADLKKYGLKKMDPLVLGGFASGNGFTTHPVVELFFDGNPLPMARYPNEGMLHVVDVSVPDDHALHGRSGSKTGRIIYDGDRPARWKDEKDAMLYGYWFFDWADSYERITGVDTEKHEIVLSPPYHKYGYCKGARYYAINLLSEIDIPGEWYLDRENTILYLYPPSDPGGAIVELSLLSSPMLQLENVSQVRFEGLTWELGSGDAIIVKKGTGCVFAGCTVRRFGGNGIAIQGGSNHKIVSCDIYSMGRGGTRVDGGDRKSLKPGGHVVENCAIHHLSRIDHTYTPAVWMDGVGNRIAHNRMHHINSSAMRIEGNDHIIEYNEVHDVLLESDDQGGADMFGNATYRGNVFRYNYWHHSGNWQHTGEDLSCGQAGIRLDDAISGTLIHGNIFYRCASGKLGFGGVQIHGGKDNVVENNIFAECTAAVSFSPWGADRWQAFVEKALDDPEIDAELYKKRYPDLAHLKENPNANVIRKNLVWKCGEFLRRDSGKNTVTDNVITEDGSCFVDAGKGDFSMKKSNCTVAPPHFEAIPFEKIGLYRDAFRDTLPGDNIKRARARN